MFLFQAHAPFKKLHDMKYDPKANTQEFTIQVLNRDHYIYSSIAKQEWSVIGFCYGSFWSLKLK